MLDAINCFSISSSILVDQNISNNDQDDIGDVFDSLVKDMISPRYCCHLAMSKKNYAYLIGGKFTVEIVLPLALKFCKHLNFFSFSRGNSISSM